MPEASPIRPHCARRGDAAHRRTDAGFTLILLAGVSIVILGVVGLAFDVGRMYVVKNELQTYCDSAAMAGVRSLDGTRLGVNLAHETAVNGPLGAGVTNGVNFNTAKPTAVAGGFSETLNGRYVEYATASSAGANRYRFLKVDASYRVKLYFLGAAQGSATGVDVKASAIAGQQEQPAVFNNGGLIPFSVAAHSAADPVHFGLIPGQRYTLKWGRQGAGTDCAGDEGWAKASSFAAQRGYVDLGQGNGSSGLRKAIEYGGYPDGIHAPASVGPGDTLDALTGTEGPFLAAMKNRALQDPDQGSTTWAQYSGKLQRGLANGRRLVTTLIDDPGEMSSGGKGSYRSIGFGSFLLDPAAVYESNDTAGRGSYCATYLGPANLNGGGTGGASGTSMYRVVLYR